ncbi:hypothetical protein GQ44DRAFT_769812 [Phaeosphaeriaceae sp. PMI808]|nr:hypothetical protein GQ44DRAFT_769812 [Phaeosphaeriaceae sp. PMI808]
MFQDLRVDELAEIANSVEANYHSTGIYYHRTEMSARQIENLAPPNRIQRLKELFEISTIEQYKDIMKPLKEAVQGLKDLPIDDLISSETKQELFHRYQHDFLPKYRKLEAKIKGISQDMKDCNETVNLIMFYSLHHREERPSGLRYGWYEETFLHEGKTSQPYHQGEEWKLCVAWVCTLPSSQQYLKGGLSREKTTMQELWGPPPTTLTEVQPSPLHTHV